jgi:XamI restriction endonuclease
MAAPGWLQPPRWSPERLDSDRQAALNDFIKSWGEKGTSAYRAAFEANEPVVRRLFQLTEDLREFSGEVFREDRDLLDAARYLGGPPVSEDDLATLAGAPLPRLARDPELASRTADVLRSAWDPIRYPWLGEDRTPTEHERHAAIVWTAGIWAVERVRTLQRTRSSREQEKEVARVLLDAGFRQYAHLRRLSTLDELPRGSFSKETNLAGSKCDVPVRLRDGRLLAIECKVSNSALNSVKRLIRETGGKARHWRTQFGLQVVTAAVLAGVYKLTSLVDAQDSYDIAIFWERNLAPLAEFVSGAG